MEIISAQLGHTVETSQKYANTEDDFSFFDLLDMINPLQHIPVVGTIYRAISGDTIKPISNIIGGALFGGPAGAAIGIVNAVVEHETGDDLLGNVSSFAFADKSSRHDNEIKAYESLPTTLLAQAEPPVYAHNQATRYNS